MRHSYCATLSMVLGSLLLGSRNRQVMSPNAHLPMPSITLLATTAPAIFLLFTGLFFGNLPVTVSLLPTMVLTRTSCLGQTVPIGGCKLLSEGSGPELDTDLCQFLSMNCALVTHHFAHTLAQSGKLAKQTVFLFIFSCIASISCVTSFSSVHLTLECPLGSHSGVEGKRRKRTSLKFLHFARLRSQTVPRAEGSYSLGFTPSCRPTAGGPAPFTLLKCRFPPGSVCGVGRKRAREALSLLCLTLLFSLLRFQPYLSAQLNSAMSLPIHKDKNNHSMTWLIALGNFAGGRLWIESPVGTHPPPLPRNSVEKKLRGEYLDTKNTWICFDPQLYHAVEPVTSGVRVSLALFTPKGWKKLRPNCIDDLIDIGFCPPLPTLTTHPSQCDVASSSDTHITTTSTVSDSVLESLPTASGSGPSTLPIASGSGPSTLPISSSSVSSTPLTASGSLSSTLPISATDSVNNHDLATLVFGPTPSEAYSFTEPQQEEMDEIHGWCTSDLVALPSAPLPSSDGMISPLDPHELEELSDHLRSGHAAKSNLCRGCLQSERPRKIHRSIRDIDKATHTLCPIPRQS